MISIAFKPQVIILILAIVSCTKPAIVAAPSEKTLEIKGVDISYLPELRKYNISIKNTSGIAEDMLTTLKNEGVNTCRIRLWVKPTNDNSSFNEVKALSQEVRNLGLKVWITVHYSDNWADPGKQTKPSQWAQANFAQLKDSVYAYTKKIVTEINPDYIQIGNEINSGLLWPDANISNITQMKAILQQGIKAVRDNQPRTKIMLHYAGYQYANSFFSNFLDLDFDIIGLSYYPFWHGKDLADFKLQLQNLGNATNKSIVIAETAYPFTLTWNDYTNNIIGLQNQILPEFDATPQGQKDFLAAIKTTITNTSKGIGFCYWGGEWVAFKGSTATDGSSWENQALWDFNFKALPALKIFN